MMSLPVVFQTVFRSFDSKAQGPSLGARGELSAPPCERLYGRVLHSRRIPSERRECHKPRRPGQSGAFSYGHRGHLAHVFKSGPPARLRDPHRPPSEPPPLPLLPPWLGPCAREHGLAVHPGWTTVDRRAGDTAVPALPCASQPGWGKGRARGGSQRASPPRPQSDRRRAPRAAAAHWRVRGGRAANQGRPRSGAALALASPGGPARGGRGHVTLCLHPLSCRAPPPLSRLVRSRPSHRHRLPNPPRTPDLRPPSAALRSLGRSPAAGGKLCCLQFSPPQPPGGSRQCRPAQGLGPAAERVSVPHRGVAGRTALRPRCVARRPRRTAGTVGWGGGECGPPAPALRWLPGCSDPHCPRAPHAGAGEGGWGEAVVFVQPGQGEGSPWGRTGRALCVRPCQPLLLLPPPPLPDPCHPSRRLRNK